MGRGVQKVRKVIDVSTPKKLKVWEKKVNRRFWSGNGTVIVPKFRQWVILGESKDLAMVHKELLKDSDGDQVYKLAILINKDGTPTTQHGFIRSYDTIFIKSAFALPIPEETQKQIDAWIGTAREDVLREDPKTGFRDTIVEIEPLAIDIPGWERLTEKALKARRMQNIKSMMGF
jgi:hypothetical protein